MLLNEFVVFVLTVIATASCKSPNIILMLMDDMGWGDLGMNGEPSRETPNLDRMAAEGAVITDFYTGAPLCSPSRATLMTGRLPVRNGFYSNNGRGRNAYCPEEILGGISKDEVLISEILAKRGYRNMIIGKWHLGHLPQYHPLRHGFHEFYGSPNTHVVMWPQAPVYRDENMIGRYFEEFKISPNGTSDITRLFTQEAVKFIKKQAISGEPFFLYWTPDSTHGPVYASHKFRGTSRRGLYGDAVRELDFGVGEILETLEKTGLSKNTFILFASDNGAALVSKQHAGSNGPFVCGKQTTFEGGMRSPGIAWWPGRIPPGTVSYQTGMFVDVLPTIVSIVGAKLPNTTLDGVSLTDSLIYNRVTIRPVFLYRGDLLMAVRYGKYKIHLWTWTTPEKELKKGIDHCPDINIPGVTTSHQTNHTEHPVLYNIEQDPGERYPINKNSLEYRTVVPKLINIANKHKKDMVWGKPQLNWCDQAAKNWSPPGCERINQCLPKPASRPYLCVWDH